MIAADFGRTKAGKLLLEKGAKINCLDKVSHVANSDDYIFSTPLQKNYTPLAEACQNGHHEFVSMMIEHDPTIRLDGEPEVHTPVCVAECIHCYTHRVLGHH